MYAYDIVGYTRDGEIFCPTHKPECPECQENKETCDEVGVVFAESETDCPAHCGTYDCEALIQEDLTPDGYRYVADALRAWALSGDGHAPTLVEWLYEYGQTLRSVMPDDDAWDTIENALDIACTYHN